MTSSRGWPLQLMLSTAFSVLACLAVLASGAGLWAASHAIGPETGVVAQTALISSIAFMMLAAAAAVFMKIHVERHLTARLTELSQGIEALVSGGHRHATSNADEVDEIDSMLRSVSILREQMAGSQDGKQEKNTAQIDIRARADANKAFKAESNQVIDAAIGGDFSRRVETNYAYQELNTSGERINQLVGTVDKATIELSSMLQALADGDLTHRISDHYQGKFSELKENANNTAGRLTTIIGGIQNTATEVGSAASEIGSGTKDLAHRTGQAASNLEKTAASTEKLSVTVKQNASNAESANQLASAANKVASEGGDVVEQAVKAMAEIDGSATKITDIITVIDEIAFQTNLLALNASVEAARAGDAGKGFAVVAQEVRALAQRSAQAASDIKGLIQNSNGQVKQGVSLVNQAGESLRKILSSIGQVAQIVEQISPASSEQASGVQQINTAITEMDDMTQQNATLVEESTAAALALGDQAQKLQNMVGFFQSGETSSSQARQIRQESGPAATSTRSAAMRPDEQSQAAHPRVSLGTRS